MSKDKGFKPGEILVVVIPNSFPCNSDCVNQAILGQGSGQASFFISTETPVKELYETRPFEFIPTDQIKQYNTSEIITISPDDIPTCPKCPSRLEPVEDINSEDGTLFIFASDDDGPIYLGKCKEHGQWLFQIESKDDRHDRLVNGD